MLKDGWTVTDDPYTIQYEGTTVFADLAAERLIAAVRGTERIAIEIKSFIGRSPMHDVERAMGQYMVYFGLMERTDPERKLFLALSETAYDELIRMKAVEVIWERFQVPLLVVSLETEEILTWIR